VSKYKVTIYLTGARVNLLIQLHSSNLVAELTLSSLQAQAASNKNRGMQEGKYQSRKHSQPAGRSKGKESLGEK
jgi:hypothetical protein